MSENTQPDDHDNVTPIEPEPKPTELDEKDIRILELEHMILLQTNTITAFQNRVWTLEMNVIELMSQIEFNNNSGRKINIPGPPPTIPQ